MNLENLGGEIGVRRGQRCREVVLGLAEAEVQLLLDLQLHDAATPAVGDSLLDVEIPRGGVFDHLDEPDEVPPRQL